MNTNRVILFVGITLAVALLCVSFQLQAQSAQSDTQWEYLFVDYTFRVDTLPLTSVYLNRAPYEFDGTVYELYASLGADGWEYAGIVDDSLLFKRQV